MNKKLIAVIVLVVALIVQSVPALAVDATLESVTEPTITTEPAELPEDNSEPAPTPPDDGGEGIDTPVEESPSEGPETDYTATTVEELIQVIEQAEAGATIGIGCEIVCPAGTTLGVSGKPITLQRTAPEGHISFFSSDGTGNVNIENITFDGSSIESTRTFVSVSLVSVFSNCVFTNCTAGAITADGEDFMFFQCTFENNSAQQGAHIQVDNGTGTFYTCTFTGGTATIQAGAIACYTTQTVTLYNCRIYDNTAAQRGGGIWNRGELIVSQSRIFNNTAGDQPDDIVNESELSN